MSPSYEYAGDQGVNRTGSSWTGCARDQEPDAPEDTFWPLEAPEDPDDPEDPEDPDVDDDPLEDPDDPEDFPESDPDDEFAPTFAAVLSDPPVFPGFTDEDPARESVR